MTVEAWMAAPVPASKPAIAALVMRALVVLVMKKHSSRELNNRGRPSNKASQGLPEVVRRTGRAREVPIKIGAPSRLASPKPENRMPLCENEGLERLHRGGGKLEQKEGKYRQGLCSLALERDKSIICVTFRRVR